MARRHQSTPKPACRSDPAPAAIVSATGEWRNWQTRRIQVPVSARTWGFKSPLAHEIVMSRGVATCPDETWKAGQIRRHKVGPDGGFTLGPVPPARTGPGGDADSDGG